MALRRNYVALGNRQAGRPEFLVKIMERKATDTEPLCRNLTFGTPPWLIHRESS